MYETNPFGESTGPGQRAGTATAGTTPGIETCPDEGGNNYQSACKLEVANRIIAESTVVLKNENGLLPLRRGARVALVGEQGCASGAEVLAQGRGSGWNGFACNKVPKVNVKEGIAAIGADIRVSCPDQGAANSAADAADVVLVVVAAPLAQEGTDRASLQLSAEDTALIQSLSGLKAKLVVAMNAPGRAHQMSQTAQIATAFDTARSATRHMYCVI